MVNRIFFIFLLSCCSAGYSEAQLSPPQNDTIKIYKDLERISHRSKLGKLIYTIFFKSTTSGSHEFDRVRHQPYSRYEGKIIRQININVIDPFGYNIKDTSVNAHLLVNKAANALHVNSKNSAIQSLLLFRPNQVFDSLYVKESARILRSQRFIREVMFSFAIPKHSPDSVDVYINVLDTWSILPNGMVRPSYKLGKLTDYNFLGFGHQFSGSLKWQTSSPYRTGYETSYLVPSIHSTHISSYILFSSDIDNSYIRQLSVERTYFSPLTKWAGGVSLKQQLLKDSILYPDSTNILQNFRFNTFDYWISKAWPLSTQRSERDRFTKLIVSARLIQTRYLDRPDVRYDSLGVYTNEDFYIAGIGITTRKYIEDSYIFNYGLTEDVPIGKLWEFIAGYQVKNNKTRGYVSLRVSRGNYYDFGHFSSYLQYGTFFSSYGFSQGVALGGIDYFTNLLEFCGWRFRQFIKSQILLGINRLPTDRVYINESFGLKGFNIPTVYGVHRLLLTVQSQSYAPWNIIGFRFGPFAVYSLGILADSRLRVNRLYSLFGLGLLIKNEYLQSRYFQVSLSFYPFIPGSGRNVVKLNTYKTTDFGFQNFDLGKPNPIIYQ